MTRFRQGLDKLEERPGYALKRASVALQRAMNDALRPCGLSLAQYACLEVLARNPGGSTADLARAAFVTRQAAHQVLKSLVDEDLVARSAHPTLGQRSQLTLTASGEQRRRTGAVAVDAVERTLAGALPAGGAEQLVALLRAVTDVLEPSRRSVAGV
jgi:DNA-binding MarR family transcriptional regulator